MHQRNGSKGRGDSNHSIIIRGGDELIERSFILKDEMGLHARPAALLMIKMLQVRSDVKISCNGNTADAKDVMAIMAMNTVAGDEVVFCREGPDEEEAMKAVESVLAGYRPGQVKNDLSLRPGLDKVIMNK